MYRQALELRGRVLGPEHPDTITSINNLAGTVEQLGRVQEAALLYKQLWEVSAKVWGSEDVQTVEAHGHYERCSQAD
jgi:hypothetical protein